MTLQAEKDIKKRCGRIKQAQEKLAVMVKWILSQILKRNDHGKWCCLALNNL